MASISVTPATHIRIANNWFEGTRICRWHERRAQDAYKRGHQVGFLVGVASAAVVTIVMQILPRLV